MVPLLGSRTLIRELADDLKFKITDPYRVWFHNRQVNVLFYFMHIEKRFEYSFIILLTQMKLNVGWRLGN